MTTSRLYNLIAIAVLVGVSLLIAQISFAGLWVPPVGNPPLNNIDPIEVDGADGLGDHTANQDILMEGYKVLNVGSVSGWALQATSTNSGATLSSTASTGMAVNISSSASGFTAAEISNLSPTGIGISIQSAGPIAGYFGKKIVLDSGDTTNGLLQLSTNINDLMSLGYTVGAGNRLYWGDKLVCDGALVNCGHVLGSAGDNLGNHTAGSALNMNNYRIFDIHNSDIPSQTVERALSGNNLGTGVGFASYSSGWHGLEVRSEDNEASVAGSSYAVSAEPAAVIGYNYGSGYGIWASSAIGPAAQLIGRMQLSAAGFTQPALALGVSGNTLKTQAGTPTTAQVYWGDKILCDGSEASCGVVAGDPGYEFWTDESDDHLYSDKIISIGGRTKKSKLEVLVPANAALTRTVEYDVDGGPDIDADFAVAGGPASATNGSLLYALGGYSSSNTTKIKIFKLLNPSILVSNGGDYSVSHVGTYTVASSVTPTDIAIAGTYAYVTDSSASVNLRVINFSNPAAGSEVATLNWGSGSNIPRSIYIKGHYAYIAEQGAFTVIDIQNPTSPSFVVTKTGGSWTSLEGHTLHVVGRYAYTADGSNGFHVIDINDPANPTIVGSHDFGSDSIGELEIRGNLLVATGSSGASHHLYFVDVSDRTSPIVKYDLTLSHELKAIQIAGQYVYGIQTSSDPGFVVIDIHDLSLPFERAGSVGSLGGNDLIVIGSRAFISGAVADLLSVDVSGSLIYGLDIAHLETDTFTGNYVRAEDTLYVSGSAVVGDVVNSAAHISVHGRVIIGDSVLTPELLEQLLIWCGASCS